MFPLEAPAFLFHLTMLYNNLSLIHFNILNIEDK